MLAGAAEMVAARQASKKKPRTYHDYREMLTEKDLDIVLIATPDHWHALPMIAAVEAGADVYVQKPISVDVIEGQAMLAAARKHKRVVQVGTQRRSTPHLIEARDDDRREGKLGKVGLVEIYSYYGSGAGTEPGGQRRPRLPRLGDVDRPGPDAALQPHEHPRGWRSFMEYGNGIVGDMCIHMLDTVRWMLDLGSPEARQLLRRHHRAAGRKANIPTPRPPSSTSATSRSSGSTAAGAQPPDPSYPWGVTFYGDKGTLKASINELRLHAARGRRAHPPRGRRWSSTSIPEDRTRRTWRSTSPPAIRGHMKDFLAPSPAAASRSPTSSRATSPPPPASWRTCP